MSLEIILFVVLAIVAVVSSVLMITRLNAVYSALFLILNFFALGGLYLLLQAQFIAVAQIIVYAGAIMVLFLFIIMLLDVKHTSKEEIFYENKKFFVVPACLIFFAIFFSIATMAYNSSLMQGLKGLDWLFFENSNIKAIGKVLFNKYLLPFEVTSLLLLVAAIGIIVLGKKKNI